MFVESSEVKASQSETAEAMSLTAAVLVEECNSLKQRVILERQITLIMIDALETLSNDGNTVAREALLQVLDVAKGIQR